MKYYNIIIYGTKKAIYEYDSKETALSAFYSELSKAYKESNIDIICMCVDSKGCILETNFNTIE